MRQSTKSRAVVLTLATCLGLIAVYGMWRLCVALVFAFGWPGLALAAIVPAGIALAVILGRRRGGATER
jgi:hypothetical protein